MGAQEKKNYHIRIKRVEADLLDFGVSTASARRLTYSYSVLVLERLITATKKRQPDKPATYFLNGLKKSRMKHRPQADLIEGEDA